MKYCFNKKIIIKPLSSFKIFLYIYDYYYTFFNYVIVDTYEPKRMSSLRKANIFSKLFQVAYLLHQTCGKTETNSVRTLGYYHYHYQILLHKKLI